MKHLDVLRAFGIAIKVEQSLESLYTYAPVYRFLIFHYSLKQSKNGQDFELKILFNNLAKQDLHDNQIYQQHD